MPFEALGYCDTRAATEFMLSFDGFLAQDMSIIPREDPKPDRTGVILSAQQTNGAAGRGEARSNVVRSAPAGRLSAHQRSRWYVGPFAASSLEIEDDGRGIDTQKLRRILESRGKWVCRNSER